MKQTFQALFDPEDVLFTRIASSTFYDTIQSHWHKQRTSFRASAITLYDMAKHNIFKGNWEQV